MRLPSWLALYRRARRNRRRLSTIPAVELLEDRTLLTLLWWEFDPGTGHLEFTTDEVATSITVQASGGTVEVVGWGLLIGSEMTVAAEDLSLIHI